MKISVKAESFDTITDAALRYFRVWLQLRRFIRSIE